jgi:hypothetical protein
MALPFRRIGLVASSGSFIKRTAIATDLAAPRPHDSGVEQTIYFVKTFAGLS